MNNPQVQFVFAKLKTIDPKHAAIVVAVLATILFVGFTNLLYLFLLAIVGVAIALLRPLPVAATKAANDRRFSQLKLSSAYDFIVVGAGASGCVLARKLADARGSDGAPLYRVLLIESGRSLHTNPVLSKNLPAWFQFATNIDYDYDLSSEVMPNLNGRTVQYCRGHSTGGSTMVNAMMWVVGHRADYDDWSQKFGATGWDWKSIQPHFHSLENYVDADSADTARGKTGPVEVRTCDSKEHKLFIDAAVRQGIAKRVADYNSGDNTGVAPTQQNSSRKDRVRQDAFSRFIEPYLASGATNLHVVDQARSERIMFDESSGTPRAIGVVFRVASQGSFAVRAKRELLLSCGAIHTPQLLMLSGIGPSSHLREKGIRVIADLPVGEQFEDHACINLPFVLKDVVSANDVGGALGSNMHIYSTWAKENEPKRGPDLQLVCACSHEFYKRAFPILLVRALKLDANRLSTLGTIQRNLGPLLTNALSAIGWLDRVTSRLISIGVVLNHPQSLGSITLASSNPEDHPLIDLGLLKSKVDMDRFIEAVKISMKLFKDSELAAMVDKPDDAVKPCVDGDRNAIEQLIRSQATHAWHASGTARIGTVVSNDLKVKGIAGLRVVDCSIMPALTSGNTMVPAMIIGSRGAQFILDEHATK